MIGKGYSKWLSQLEQMALAQASTRLIDAFFDERSLLADWTWEKPGAMVSTKVGKHLPRHYAPYYTPLFYKQMGVCLVTVAWKLAQSEVRPLASAAEGLAARAMVEEAREMLKGAGAEGYAPEAAQPFQAFSEGYVKPAVLNLFDPPPGGPAGREERYRAELAIDSWFHAFSTRVPPHPYCWSGAAGLRVGRAYKHALRPSEQRALDTGIEALIDEVFRDFPAEGDFPLGRSFANTALGDALPRSYYPRYTLQFLKKFTVCILTVAWKLAQPKHLRLSSVAEELAAHAILTQAKDSFEHEQETLEEGERPDSKILPGQAFERFREVYFEDEDFLFLFDARYEGVDQSPVGRELAMSSLAFDDWLQPFNDGPERLAHPYVYGG